MIKYINDIELIRIYESKGNNKESDSKLQMNEENCLSTILNNSVHKNSKEWSKNSVIFEENSQEFEKLMQ